MHAITLLTNYVIDIHGDDAGLRMGAPKKNRPLGGAGENAFEGAGIEETVPD